MPASERLTRPIDVQWTGGTDSTRLSLAGVQAMSIYLDPDFAGTALCFKVDRGDGTQTILNDGGERVSTKVIAGEVNRLPAWLTNFKGLIFVSTNIETGWGTVLTTG